MTLSSATAWIASRNWARRFCSSEGWPSLTLTEAASLVTTQEMRSPGVVWPQSALAALPIFEMAARARLWFFSSSLAFAAAALFELTGLTVSGSKPSRVRTLVLAWATACCGSLPSAVSAVRAIISVSGDTVPS